MNDRVILTIEKLKELCPKCANKIVQDSLTKGITVKKVSMLKVDYDRLTEKITKGGEGSGVKGHVTSKETGQKYKTHESGTSYSAGTPDHVVSLLEHHRQNGTRLKFEYGDSKTGQSWGDTQSGRIGRSTGPIKIPLIIHNERSMGGEGLLDSSIVRISHAAGDAEVYKHPSYKEPKEKNIINRASENTDVTKQDAGGTMEAIKKNEDRIEKLKKDIETVMCWRKFGKALNREQQQFADRVAGEMIGMKTEKQVGVQLMSRENINFIRKGMIEKGMQPIQGSDAVAGITQDVVAIGPAKKPCTCGKVGCSCDAVTKFEQPTKATLPTSAEESGKEPRKSPNIESISKEPIEGQREGEVNAVADSKVDPKTLSPDDKGEIKIEEIGHQPNLPMPRKMAEELIANAKWGVEIGAYKSVSEAIERILGNKEYAEFVDTSAKKDAVMACLTNLNKE